MTLDTNCCYVELFLHGVVYNECRISFIVILIVIMFNVVMLSFVAPLSQNINDQRLKAL
jgi:hypothetical protein